MTLAKRPVNKRREDLIFADEAYAIIGAAMEVYKELGSGFLEAVYQEALEIELTRRGIQFESQKPLPIQYRGVLLRKSYIADLICHGKIIIELKAADQLTSKDTAQLLNYLKATQMKLGLLINFGSSPLMEWERRVN